MKSEPETTLEAYRQKITHLLPHIKTSRRLKLLYDFAHALWLRQLREK